MPPSERFRQRKRGEEKPLAVMVKSLGVAEALAIVGDEARRLLTSVERPIVVLPKRQGHGLAPSVAPHNRMVGLFLPHSPLHHLRLAEAARPLVMTSGCLCVPPEVELATPS
jgi:hydrogenase maturation protein HypF